MQRQLQYLELAPAGSQADSLCPLCLQIWIQNNEAVQLNLTQVDATFADPSFNYTVMPNLTIGPGAYNAWYATNNQYAYLPSPPPTPFTIILHFTGFDPWSDQVNFVPFTHSYNFPGKISELGADEF